MKRAAAALKKEDPRMLREIAKELIIEAAEEYNREKASEAVISYALSKILSKVHIVNDRRWHEYKRALIDAIERDYSPEKITAIISSLDEEMGNFVRSTLDKARLKMAAEAYGMGLSLRASANLTGADIHDLADYIGETKIHDEEEYSIDIRKRVEGLKRLWRG